MESSSLTVPPQNQAMLHAGGYHLSGPEKAAVILALLGAESAGPVVEKIEDRHLRAFMKALENLKLIPRESMLACVADFITELSSRQGGLRGGPKAARELAESLFEQERVARLFGASPVSTDSVSDGVWVELMKRKNDDIVKYLAGQQSEVVSIILSNFPTNRAGEILTELPEEISVACVKEMSRETSIGQRTIDAVAELVKIEFLTGEDAESDKPSSVAFVSEVLGILPSGRRDVMLKSIEKTDPEQADKIRKGMMTFEDLPKRLPTTAIPILFKDFDQEKLLTVLKVGEEEEPATIEFFFANISQRMAGQFKEQIEEMGGVSQKQADSAISSMMGFIGQLEKAGRITLVKPAPEAAED